MKTVQFTTEVELFLKKEINLYVYMNKLPDIA